MLNQIVLVGRLKEAPTIKSEKGGKNSTIITLAVPRSYRNADGEYEVDIINCKLWTGVAETTVEYCKKGSLLGVKGHVESLDDKMIIIAEKVTFLTSKRADE